MTFQIIFYSPRVTAECDSLFSQIQKPSNQIVWLDDQVAILFYPNQWHAELVVDGKMYNRSIMGFGRTRSFEAAKKSANQGYDGFIAFYIRVNEDELNDLKNYLLAHPGGSLSCMYGACKPLKMTTGLKIPEPITLLPLTTSIYLGIKKFFEGTEGRIQKIEFIAKDIKSLKIRGSLPAELTAVFSIGLSTIFIVSTIYIAGNQVYQLVIPLLSDSLNLPDQKP